jgi:hypothetical protein
MKLRCILAPFIAVLALSTTSRGGDSTPSLDDLPPVVVKAVPEPGAVDVPAGVVEFRVTFSKPMADRNWTFYCCTELETPEMYASRPGYDTDGRTFVVKMNLKPGKTYGFWVNSPSRNNFRDLKGNRALPYLIMFKTRS